jgi:membrane protease YdiL (CAAX protease family)
MPKCTHCGRWSKKTNEYICPYCGQPILGENQEKIHDKSDEILDKIDRFIRLINNISAKSTTTQKNEFESKSIYDSEEISREIERAEHIVEQFQRKLEASRRTKAEKQNALFISIIYLFAIGIGEFITYYLTQVGGIILHFTILLILIINSAIVQEKAKQGFWLALSLVPLIRIVSLAVPIAEISEIYWYVIIAIPVLIGVILIMRTLNYNFSDVGLNAKKPLIQTLVAVAGLFLGFANYIIFKPEAIVGEFNIQTLILPTLILLITTGFIEELAFRGVIQRAARMLGSWGWIYVGLIYAVLQIGHGSIIHGVFTFIIAIFWGWIVKKTGSIIGVCFSHGLLNVVIYLILPNIGCNLPSLFIKLEHLLI